jgi:hypothetical protein
MRVFAFCSSRTYSGPAAGLGMSLAAGRPATPHSLAVHFRLDWGPDPDEVTTTTSGEATIETVNACTQAMLDDARSAGNAAPL